MRHILATIGVPTLILHRAGDRVVQVPAGRYLAEHIPGARYRELPGIDHHVLDRETMDLLADEIEEFVTGERHRLEPDRVLATVMFTDIVGSTERAAQIGDQRWRDLLGSFYEVMRKELRTFRGKEVDTAGDGMLATFDGPARAIRCACAARDKVRQLGLEVRIGLHAGECELIGAGVGGIAVHIGARVASTAKPAEVLVSSTVKDSSRRLGDPVRGPRDARAQGHPGRLAPVRRAVIRNLRGQASTPAALGAGFVPLPDRVAQAACGGAKRASAQTQARLPEARTTATRRYAATS